MNHNVCRSSDFLQIIFNIIHGSLKMNSDNVDGTIKELLNNLLFNIQCFTLIQHIVFKNRTVF